MDFEEHAAKCLLEKWGIAVPAGRLVQNPVEAEQAAREIGPCVVKAQIAAGGRGNAGGILPAATPAEARDAAERVLGMEIGSHKVRRLRVETRICAVRELYAAVMSDPGSRRPVLLFSPLGGVDVERAAMRDPSAMRRLQVDIHSGPAPGEISRMIAGTRVGNAAAAVAATLERMYRIYRATDADLLEINPLAITPEGQVIAVDGKFTLDDGAASRQPELAALAAEPQRTQLEAEAAAEGLQMVELEGDIGVLANGAGLTMATMDAISHFGGQPANFLEVGGDGYTKGRTALRILLRKPGLRSVVVNFCGAFARTDILVEGVIAVLKELELEIPVYFSVHGTGEERAIELLRRELGVDPFFWMDDAVRAAVAAAHRGAS